MKTKSDKITANDVKKDEAIHHLINHKIARLVVTDKQYDKNGNPIFSKLEKIIEKFLSKEYGHSHFEIILTPGGFLNFDFPDTLLRKLDIENAENNNVKLLQKEANSVIINFFKKLGPTNMKKLKEIADFFTIGIDGYSNNKSIELVAIYNLKKEKVIQWTGKFYPTERQKRYLIRINDLSSHLIEVNNQKILILGCHDLNVFSHRGQANAKPNGWRRQLADEFKKLCIKNKPEIVLQHPHNTYSPRIWLLGWSGLVNLCPSIKHYASGINYSILNEGDVLRPIEKVLKQTRRGDVIDIY